jgi:hypothetical protein
MPRKEPPLDKSQRGYLTAFEALLEAERNDDVAGQQRARAAMRGGLDAMDAPPPSESKPLYRTGEYAGKRRRT